MYMDYVFKLCVYDDVQIKSIEAFPQQLDCQHHLPG